MIIQHLFRNPFKLAKHYADKALAASSLNYTIIRPGGLLNEAGTGKISVSENEDRKSIPREDVAKTAIASLNEERTYKQAFDLVSGDKVINEALKAI